MTVDDWRGHWLGRTSHLTVERIVPHGAYLALEDGDRLLETVLLPRAELSPDLRPGDTIDAFVYLDSEDRPVASTRMPRLVRGQVGFLRVSDVTRIGAFVDWGLPKELLVPFAEQTRDLQPGDREPFGVVLDETGRLAATMRIRELLARPARFARDEWVEGEAWREEPGIGVFVIVARRYLGLLPAHEPHSLRRGEAARFRVAHVLPDGKLELSLRGHVHEELERDAEHVLGLLRARGARGISERASPEEIRAFSGLSKKAFKRAIGRLLREREVALDDHGVIVAR